MIDCESLTMVIQILVDSSTLSIRGEIRGEIERDGDFLGNGEGGGSSRILGVTLSRFGDKKFSYGRFVRGDFSNPSGGNSDEYVRLESLWIESGWCLTNWRYPPEVW